MDVKNSNPQIPKGLKKSLESLVNKIDTTITTYEITREELFALLSDVLDGDIDG